MLESWGCGLYTSAAYTRVFTVITIIRVSIKNFQQWEKDETLQENNLKENPHLNKKLSYTCRLPNFSSRIQSSKRRILRSSMPNEPSE